MSDSAKSLALKTLIPKQLMGNRFVGMKFDTFEKYLKEVENYIGDRSIQEIRSHQKEGHHPMEVDVVLAEAAKQELPEEVQQEIMSMINYHKGKGKGQAGKGGQWNQPWENQWTSKGKGKEGKSQWNPWQATNTESHKGGKKGKGKGEPPDCWTCGKKGHMSRDCWSKGKGKGKSLWNVGEEDSQEEGSQNTPEEYGQDEYNPDVIAIVADPIRKVCCSNKIQALEEEDEQTEDEEQTKNHGWNPWVTVIDKTKEDRARKEERNSEY